MKDVNRLRAAVTAFTPSEDGKTFFYRIDMAYGGIEWPVLRRFSEFHSLHGQLFAAGYAGLPDIPAKSLRRPNDSETAQIRQNKLHKYLIQLLIRHDIRFSPQINYFLEFEDHVFVSLTTTRPAWIIGTEGTFGISVSDFAYDPNSGIVALTQEDVTPLSKLGKAWLLVESEEVGAISIWKLSSGSGMASEGSFAYSGSADSPPMRRDVTLSLSRCYQKSTSQRMTVCGLVRRNRKLHALFGDEQGELDIFDVTFQLNDYGDLVAELELLRCIEMNVKARLLELHQTETGGLLTIGLDGGIRAMMVGSDSNYEMASGGRVVKPLDSKETLVSCFLLGTTAILGTSHAKLLLYDMTNHPPAYLVTVDLAKIIQSIEYPTVTEDVPTETRQNLTLLVSSIDVARLAGKLCVAVDAAVLILRLSDFTVDLDISKLTQDPSYTLLARIDPPNDCYSPISALCVWEDLRSSNCFLFTAHHRVISVWSLTEREGESPRLGSEEGDVSSAEIPSDSASVANVLRPQLLHCFEEFTWGRITKLKVCNVPLEGGDDYLAILGVATSNRGLNFLCLSQAGEWTTWWFGVEELERIKEASRKQRNVISQKAFQKICLLEDRSTQDEKDEMDIDNENDDDLLLAAFGSARF